MIIIIQTKPEILLHFHMANHPRVPNIHHILNDNDKIILSLFVTNQGIVTDQVIQQSFRHQNSSSVNKYSGSFRANHSKVCVFIFPGKNKSLALFWQVKIFCSQSKYCVVFGRENFLLCFCR